MKVKIRIGNEVKEYTGAWEDHTLLEVFQELGITQVHAPCGGNGTCKKCLVTVEGLGEVLSCQTQCKDDMCVTVAEEQKSAIAENGNCYLYPADAGEGLLAACGWSNRSASLYSQRTECTAQFWRRCHLQDPGIRGQRSG